MDIKAIIIHCSATLPGQEVTTDLIRQWHIKRGFDDIGYHFVITRLGRIERGRTLERPGAHTKGHNWNSIGVCYIGGLDNDGNPRDTRTPNQRKALVKLIKRLIKKYPGIKHIYGHRNFAAKACPCFDAGAEYQHLIEE